MTKVLIALIAITTAFVVVSSVFFIAVWPDLFEDGNIARYDGLTKLGGQISEFQTLIGGFLTAFAALVTAISIYAATVVPTWIAEKREQRLAELKRRISAMILAKAVSVLRGNFIVEKRRALKSKTPINWEVDIPTELTSFDLIASQSESVVDSLAGLRLAIFPDFWVARDDIARPTDEEIFTAMEINIYLLRLEALIVETVDVERAVQLRDDAEELEQSLVRNKELSYKLLRRDVDRDDG